MVPKKKKNATTSPRDVETRKETGQDVEAIVSIRPNGKRQNLGFCTHHDKGCFLPKAREVMSFHLTRHILVLLLYIQKKHVPEMSMSLLYTCISE